jgi:exopolysaccharide production protein ExoQ
MADGVKDGGSVSPGLVTCLWFCLGQAVLMGATRGLFFAPEDALGEGPSQFAVFAVLHLASAAMLLRGGVAESLRLSLRAWPVLMLIAAATLVLVWTPNPGLFALAAARSIPPETMLRLMRRTNAVLLCLSLLVIITMPEISYSSDDRGRYWQGIFFHKNAFGLFLLFHVVLCTYGILRRTATPLDAATGLLALVLLPGTGSATPFMVAVVVVAVAVARPVLSAPSQQERNLRFLCAVGLAVPALWAMWVAADPLLTALGRDPTLTGRTDLWRVLLRDHQDHMLLGRGIACFWLDDGGPVEAVHRSLSWIALSAHNGYLDTMLSLGVFGLAGMIAMLALAWMRADRLPYPGLVRALLLMLIVYNCFESQMTRHNEWFTTLAMLLLCMSSTAALPQEEGR